MAEITGPSYIPRGTKCKCTMGATEQRLNLLVDHGIIATASREPLMNANDHIPMENIMPFGFCKKGMPCMPVTPVAWVDVNKKHIIDGAPALTEDSKLACAHGGVITIVPLDAGSAEEGDRNENAEDVVEEIASAALSVLGSIVAKRIPFMKRLVKMRGKKKSVKGGGNKEKGNGEVENKGQALNKSLENRGNNKEGVGNTVTKNPLPNMENAKIDPRKLTDYALNPEHPVGGNKAKVFESALGYNKSNADALMKQVQEKLPQSEAVLGKADQYGQRYTVDMQIIGPNGNTTTVRTGWILKSGSTNPEMTTIYVK